MRGYLSFLLAFAACMALLSCHALLGPSSSLDLSKAISVERAYGLQMDMKGAAMESIRQGAVSGFKSYDKNHEIGNCTHCPGMCLPPPAPDYCDAALCGRCFIESDARAYAISGAEASLDNLRALQADGAFITSFGDLDLEVFLIPDPLSKNGFSLQYARLRDPLQIEAESGALGISAKSELPAGLVID
ncbi:MAG: hypothetical protein V1827_00550 [Candidatus Micrarchaeota archaeon]